MRACGITSDNTPQLRTTDFYTSHEALLLGYEQALTRVEFDLRRLVRDLGAYALGRRPHAPARPRACRVSAAASRIRSALKCGPSLDADELLQLIDVLNPENEPGRLTLIARFGADKVGEHLPALIRAVEREGKIVVWSCDPMHGNTITAGTAATRRGRSIASSRRCAGFFDVHRAEGTHAGGIHVEMTGKNVTECIGGARAVTETTCRTATTPLRSAAQRRPGHSSLPSSWPRG